jgi:DNA-binding NarL/FixJ family response regulator
MLRQRYDCAVSICDGSVDLHQRPGGPRVHITSADATWMESALAALRLWHLQAKVFSIGMPSTDIGPDLWLFDWIGLDVTIWSSFLRQRDRLSSTVTLVVGGEPERFWAEQALRVGATGYLLRSAGVSELAEAIEAVGAARIYLSSQVAIPVTRRILARSNCAEAGLLGLTLAEINALQQLAWGAGALKADPAVDRPHARQNLTAHSLRIARKLGLSGVQELRRLAPDLMFLAKSE